MHSSTDSPSEILTGYPAPLSLPPTKVPKKRGITVGGIVLFVAGLMVFGSGFLSMRPAFFGLRLHPYLVPLMLAAPMVMYHFGEFPHRVVTGMGIFTVMYCIPVAVGGMPAGEVAKLLMGGLTILVTACLVKTSADFVAGTTGLCIAIGLMAAQALKPGEAVGEVLDVANKNTYSLYAVPSILMAGYISLRPEMAPRFVRFLLTGCSIVATIAIFLSANRSGYLGVVVVGLLLLWNRKLKGGFYVLLVTGFVLYAVFNIFSPESMLTRLQQTIDDTAHDEVRRNIQYACIAIALENPLFGVTFNALPLEVGRRLKLEHLAIADSHNAYLHVAAGNGLICLLALLYSLWAMFSWMPSGKSIDKRQFLEYRSLLRMLVISWCVRALFTREILYNPSFCLAIGLIIGLCLTATRCTRSTCEIVPPQWQLVSV
jgi:hypothetical protein